MKKYFWVFVFLAWNFFLFGAALAKDREITILYTGSTHAMLYPCSCPKEQDGGLARRSSLIKELQKNNLYTLLVDAGSFFAGGLMDEYTQNTQMDMERTAVDLKAMEIMKYDAAAIGEDEFNFGKEVLQEYIGKYNLNFLSANVKFDKAKVPAFLMKEVGGIKVGIIGVTSPAASQKSGGLQFIEPAQAVGQAMEELKKNGVQLVLVLGSFSEADEASLINNINGIDILISARVQTEGTPWKKIGNTLKINSNWQGRKLGKLSLTIKNDKIADYKVEELRLWDKIPDDPAILAILPRCFSDKNCKKNGSLGICQEPGTLKANCIFPAANKVSLTIITSKSCDICNTKPAEDFLRTLFPGLTVSYLYYPEGKTGNMVKDLGINGLPAYLLGKDAQKEKGFDRLKNDVEIKGEYLLIKSQLIGVSRYPNRPRIAGKLDLFLSLYDKNAAAVLDAVGEFNPQVHFLAVENIDTFDAARGKPEIEEYLRGVCVQKYYPQAFWGYIKCRAQNQDSTWWENCLSANLELEKIRACARGNEGKGLLKENISLNKALQVMYGPTYLVDNQDIFGTQGPPNKEELRKVIKK
jgi:hypothetical protein